MWAKDNSNGLPVMRWTSPRADTYSFDVVFTGNDSRGVDVYAFVIVNNVQMFSQRILGYGSIARYSVQNLAMNSGDTIDYVIQWGGSVYYETSWTSVSAIIADFTQPVDIETPCGAPYLTWSGSPTIGDSYTVTTQNLGTSNQFLLVDWSNQVTKVKYRRFGGCSVYVFPDSTMYLGNTSSYTFLIPADVGLVGAHLRAQAVLQGRPWVTTQGLDALIGE